MPRPPSSPQSSEKEQFLKVVICESRYGARLRLEFLPYDAAKRDALSKRCAEMIAETQTKCAGGIRQVIAVTHFLAKNLVFHDYDHLQAGYGICWSHRWPDTMASPSLRQRKGGPFAGNWTWPGGRSCKTGPRCCSSKGNSR